MTNTHDVDILTTIFDENNELITLRIIKSNDIDPSMLFIFDSKQRFFRLFFDSNTILLNPYYFQYHVSSSSNHVWLTYDKIQQYGQSASCCNILQTNMEDIDDQWIGYSLFANIDNYFPQPPFGLPIVK